MGKFFNKEVVSEVLALVEDGYSEKYIAAILHLSYKDVRIIVKDYQGREALLDREFDDE